MLISYGLITQDDLTKALDLQKQCGKRLGQVLVEMKLISHEEVARVLEEQLSRRENRLLWGRGESLVR
jgi:type IV pilus assembly protein PilB